MSVAKVRWKNFLCFRGDHEIELRDAAYAVGAMRDGDREQSNASGKTAFLETFGFVLWGKHRHRLEDGWISNGEAQGEAELTLTDGTRILRSRTRGKATKLRIFEGEVEYTKVDAETRLVEILGIGQVDYYATRHLEQRQVARFVLSRPEDRMGVVSAWVGLGPLERAEGRARELLSEVVKLLEQAERDRQRWVDRIAYALSGKDIGRSEPFADRDAIQAAERDAMAHGAKIKERLTAAKDARIIIESDVPIRKRLAEYTELVEEGKKLAKEVDAIDGTTLAKKHDAAKLSTAKYSVLVGEKCVRLKQLEGPYLGHFSGDCPISSIKCPATKEINADRKSARDAHEKATAAYDDASKHLASMTSKEEDLEMELKSYRRKLDKLGDMRERATKLRPEYERYESLLTKVTESVEEIRDRVTREEKAHEENVRLYGNLLWALKSYDESTAELAKVDEQIRNLKTAEETASTGVLIFGRNGAQRRVAESALTDIERRANDALNACGIELAVSVRWSREGSGLATACDACGYPFPSTTRVKTCARCNAARGPRMTHRLDIELSDQSGALEDLAGLTTSLAAGAWLRERRGSSWGTILIDEAWGQLDAAHRRSLSSGLPRMLSSWGAEQAFITAHHTSVLDALPGRIEIERREKWSEVRVVG